MKRQGKFWSVLGLFFASFSLLVGSLAHLSGAGAIGTNAADTTATINFGSASGSTNVNSASKTGNDSQGNTWTVTTVGTTSFTPNASYAQIGSKNSPATSITFTTTLASSQNITAFSAKFGGFSGTAGTVTLKVGDTSVGTGSLNAANDVTVNNTSSASGTVLTVTVTGIAKGVKAYYISYTSAGYSVTYDANGATSGDVPTDDTEYNSSATVTVLGNTGSLEKTGYVFDGWNTASDGTGNPYSAGATFSITEDTKLYAQWEEDTSLPVEASISPSTLRIPTTKTSSFVVTVLRGTLNTVKLASAPAGMITLEYENRGPIVENSTSVSNGTTVVVRAGSARGSVVITATCDDVDDNGAHPTAICNATLFVARQYELTISPSDFSSASYASNNKSHTVKAVASDDSSTTMDVNFTTNQVMQQDSKIQFQKNAGYLYNTTPFGEIKSISETANLTAYFGSTAQPETNTTVGGSYFQLKCGGTTATSDGITIVFLVEVPPVLSVSLSASTATIYTTRTITLTPTVTPSNANQSLTWTTSDSGVATVDNGVVTGVAAGSATITATSPDGPSASCVVTVSALPSIALTSNKSVLWVGDTAALTPTPSNFTPDSYDWDNSDPTVASISNGTLTALKRGTTEITASAEYNDETFESNSVSITVKKAEITLSSDAVVLQYGQSETLSITLNEFDGSADLSAVSSNNSVATAEINNTGDQLTITAKSIIKGSATITVSGEDEFGHQADDVEITVNVSSRIESLPTSGLFEAKLIANMNDSPIYMDSSLAGTDLAGSETFLIYADGRIKAKSTGKFIHYTSSTTVTPDDASSEWTISNSNNLGLIQLGSTDGRYLGIRSTSETSLKAYAYANVNSYLHVYAYQIVEPYVDLEVTALEGLKGESESNIGLTTRNFVPTSLSFSFDNSGVASIDSVVADHGYNLTVNYLDVGETTATITVSRAGGSDFVFDVGISVLRNPISLALSNATMKDGKLEVRAGGTASSGYKTMNVIMTDSDDEEVALGASDLVYEVVNGSTYVAISDGGRIYGLAAGEGIIRYKVKTKPSVYADVTVKSISDYLVKSKTVSFKTGLEATQGDHIATSGDDVVINERRGTTYFGLEDDIPYSDFTYSYTNVYADSAPGEDFVYDFSHGTDAGANGEGLARKTQTIFCFCTLDEKGVGSFEVVVTQRIVHITDLQVNNDDAEYDSAKDEYDISLVYDSSYRFDLTVLPIDTTDSKDIEFELDESVSDSSYSLTEDGVLTTGHVIDAAAYVYAKCVDNREVSVTFYIVTVRPSETIRIHREESAQLASNISIGDQVIFTAKDANMQLTGISDTSTKYGIGASFMDVPDVEAGLVFTVCAGSSAGYLAFGDANGNYLSWTSGNSLTTETSITNNSSWSVAISNGNATISNKVDSSRIIWWNSSSPRFAAYTGKSEDNQYKYARLYKVQGDFDMVVSDDLFDTAMIAMDDYMACDAEFGRDSVLDWQSIKDLFDMLSADELNNLKNAYANANGNMVERFLAAYDYIVGKYCYGGYTLSGDQGEITDFLNRKPSPPLEAYIASKRYSESPLTTTLWIVLGSGLAGLTAIGGAYLFSKKKQRRDTQA